CAEASVAGAPLTLAPYGFTGLPAFQLFVPAGAAEAVSDALLSTGLAPASGDTLECLRIAAGLARRRPPRARPRPRGGRHARVSADRSRSALARPRARRERAARRGPSRRRDLH